MTAAWGLLGVGVAGGMAGQDRRDRAVRREEGQAGQPGGVSLKIVGKASGHGYKYG